MDLIKLGQLIGFCVGGFLVSYTCNELLLRFSKSLGIRNKNDVVIRWSNESKPSLGGVSFFVVFLFASIAYSILFYEENVFSNRQFVGLFAASSLAFVMGLADDAYNTKPLIKLAVQILCGLIFVWTGSNIELFDSFILNSIITVFWVIVVMNSLNMLDNMDGITGTVVFYILVTCLLSGWMILDFNTNIWTLIVVAVIGSLLGFLMFNVHPSKLFMGDAGSQFIGLFVAHYAVNNLWQVGVDTDNPSWTGILVALIAFTPAAVDTLSVVINRLKRGQSPMVGGKDHTTHHLVYAGLTDRKVWYVFVIIGLLSLLLSVAMINLLTLKINTPLVLFIAYFLIVFVMLYRNTIKYPSSK